MVEDIYYRYYLKKKNQQQNLVLLNNKILYIRRVYVTPQIPRLTRYRFYIATYKPFEDYRYNILVMCPVFVMNWSSFKFDKLIGFCVVYPLVTCKLY